MENGLGDDVIMTAPGEGATVGVAVGAGELLLPPPPPHALRAAIARAMPANAETVRNCT
jgi:hypothetical protein